MLKTAWSLLTIIYLCTFSNQRKLLFWCQFVKIVGFVSQIQNKFKLKDSTKITLFGNVEETL